MGEGRHPGLRPAEEERLAKKTHAATTTTTTATTTTTTTKATATNTGTDSGRLGEKIG